MTLLWLYDSNDLMNLMPNDSQDSKGKYLTTTVTTVTTKYYYSYYSDSIMWQRDYEYDYTLD